MSLMKLAAAVAAGYSVARVLEANAVKVPLVTAFKPANLLKPVSALVGAASLVAAQQANVIDVTPVATS